MLIKRKEEEEEVVFHTPEAYGLSNCFFLIAATPRVQSALARLVWPSQTVFQFLTAVLFLVRQH